MNMNNILNSIAIGYLVIVVADALRRKYLSKQKPFITCLADAFCYLPFALGLGPWGEANDIHTAIIEAIKTTKLKDVGSNEADFLCRYETSRKIGLKQSKVSYSPTGYVITKNMLTKRMEQRLRLVEYLKKHPKVQEVKMRDPVFVIGYPRTGTTYLHELLGLYPNFRQHYTWEQIDLVPTTDSENIDDLERDRKKKYDANKVGFERTMMFAGDAIQSVHRVGYDESEECTTPCALELPWAICEIPFMAYSCEEVFPLGAGAAFDLYKSQLKLLTFQSKERRDQDFTWMLKCPFHLPYLSEIHKAFPGCTMVWTHRDPCECIASCCSLYEVLMFVSFENHTLDRISLGKAVLKYTKLSLERAFASIKAAGNSLKICHIRYADTVTDPKGMCKNIMEKVGVPYTDEYSQKLDDYIAKNKAKRNSMQEKKGGNYFHTYTLEEYGLSREIVENEFKDYIAEYKLKEVKSKK